MRDFYRFRMTAATAKLVVQFMVDATLEIHVTKCEGSRYRLKDNPEYWQERCNRAHGPLNLARLIENTVVIGSDKARIDLPHDPEIMALFANRLDGFLEQHHRAVRKGETSKLGRAWRSFQRLRDTAKTRSQLHPLDRLAEVGE